MFTPSAAFDTVAHSLLLPACSSLGFPRPPQALLLHLLCCYLLLLPTSSQRRRPRGSDLIHLHSLSHSPGFKYLGMSTPPGSVFPALDTHVSFLSPLRCHDISNSACPHQNLRWAPTKPTLSKANLIPVNSNPILLAPWAKDLAGIFY